jgi:hypothetical protein
MTWSGEKGVGRFMSMCALMGRAAIDAASKRLRDAMVSDVVGVLR